ncbi:MAG TPA: hypothetical protein VNL91_09790 [Thermoanaerobaculia bacterium]|nr:hypothetical protein [Thermoanaerobaculia bacterium]
MRPVAFLLAFAAACAPLAPPPGDVTHPPPVRLEATQPSGGAVRLTLVNESAAAVGYNLCQSRLQRRSGRDWTPVQTGEVCTMELRSLPPGQRAIFDKTLPPALPAGEYRYVTSVETPAGTPQRVLASQSFTVGR